ncbi:hypothetical protein BGZ95_001873 [Linnemannia exigua]|uniref:EF-hand domain-containing protein n=1 Tax=Linnemannia exigua TaxID=604196 RepID=A0AAD4H4N1_9FUNG|nr:hypothetical protein BGZ95_001873 [Linnemannia exigua]
MPANSSTFTQGDIESFRKSFDSFDRKHTGAISISDLRSLLCSINEKFGARDIDRTMMEFDTNKDNVIDYEEFLVMVNKIYRNKIPVVV